MKEQPFSFSDRIKSFTHAFAGMKIFFVEHNARIHVAAAVVVLVAGFVLGLSAYEWTAIVFAIGLVLVSEIWNTAIEHMADFMTQERNPRIKRIKDLGAAGVLLSALFAVAVGLIVFLPKLSALLFP
ncbi:MAG TPA: diacylglycerol kinase family protein [Sphingobacterium sp.]|nr:diacylglycerol kinase family protein [Sphingobacterium sp.]